MTTFGEAANKQPAPRTMAPSRDDVLSNLSFFFGDPAVPEKLRDYSEHHAMTYHFPDAYYGQNTKIRDTLNNLILRSPQEWQTNVALPFVRIEGTTVEWDELRFDVRLLQRVPYEGVSRMQTSLRRRHRDRVVRRGIGLTIESDFYSTDAGRQHFRDQLTSIRYCVQETCNFDALFAYLTSGNYDFRYDMSKGLRPRKMVRTAMAHEILMYSIVQKDGLGLDKAVEEVKYRMSRYQVTPNMMIVAPQLLLYMATAPEEKIKYMDGGERAVTRFEDGVQGYETRAFRGLGVFTSMPYEVSEESESVQMLQRSSQVGEFYRMSPPAVWDRRKLLPPQYMDLLIYDEERDQIKHVTFEQALYATGAAAPAKESSGFVDFVECTTSGDKSFIKSLRKELGMTDPDKGSFTKEDVCTAVKKDINDSAMAPLKDLKDASGATFGANADVDFNDHPEAVVIALVKCGVWVPICITIVRPFLEHLMMSAIVTVSGRDTGGTLFGPADMQVSANTSVKTIEGHYTCHTKSVITKPQNVFVMRDIMCNGYVAGGNCGFFGAPDDGTLTEPVQANAVNEDMDKRLSFADDASGEYRSLLAFLSPYDEMIENQRDQVISMSSRVLPWEVGHDGQEVKKKYFPGGDDNWRRYSKTWNLGHVHFGEDVRATESMAFMSQGSLNNSLCFIGPHRKYNPWAQNFYELIPGQGHFGPDAIPGDARWRRGESVSQKAARDSMTSIEVAAHSQLALRPVNGPVPSH
jgi:hypothetical protein